MNMQFSVRRLIILIALTLMWCALWRDISFANVAGGMLVGLGILASGLGPAARGSVNIVPLLRLVWTVLVDLVRSTINVAREVVTPTDHTDELIIAIKLPPYARDHMLVLTVAITLTPGTAVVDANPEQSIIYVHLLHRSEREATIAHAERLALLAEQALPAPGREAVA